MLYLFNSSFRPIYTENLLNMVAYPSGFYFTMRYLISGEHTNLEANLENEYLALKRNTSALIIFIDRYGADGYRYCPIRKASLHSVYKKGSSVFFVLKLKDYWFPSNVDGFCDRLISSLVKLPKFTEDAENVNDGIYAINSDDITNEFEITDGIEETWIKVTDRLHESKRFQETETQTVCLCKFSIRKKAYRIFDWRKRKFFVTEEKELKPRGEKNVLRLNWNKDYLISLYYRYFGKNKESTTDLYIEPDDNITYDNSNITISAGSNDGKELNLYVGKGNSVKKGKIELDFELKDKNINTILKPEIGISYRINLHWCIRIIVFLVLLIFVIADFLPELEFVEGERITLRTLIEKIGTLSLITSIIKGAILYYFYKEVKKD